MKDQTALSEDYMRIDTETKYRNKEIAKIGPINQRILRRKIKVENTSTNRSSECVYRVAQK